MRSGDSEQLQKLSGIGDSLARSIREIVVTGGLGFLNRLRGEISYEEVFSLLPGVGEELSRKIVLELGVDSLEDLEQAAWDGRLAEIEGIGESKLQGIRDSLNSMLSRSTSRRRSKRLRQSGTVPKKSAEHKLARPSVETIIDVDQEYWNKVRKDRLQKITPRRFNPEQEA